MIRTCTRAIALTAKMVYFAIAIAIGSSGTLNAEPQSSTAWQTEALPRLQAIYDHGEWKPAEFAASWLPDSTGYTVRKRDPQSNSEEAKKSILWRYDVQSGERTRAESQ